jgi:hypothetical protein
MMGHTNYKEVLIMKRSKNFKALARALGVVSAVVVVVSGVTFAALQSQQNVLAGNTIETATANLQISTDGTNFSNSHTGFDFNGLVPGGSAVPEAGYPFYLKNAGQTGLALKMAVTSVPSNPDNVDLSKVNVILTTVGNGAGPQTFTLQSLLGGSAPLAIGNLDRSNSVGYKLQVSMAGDAVNGNSASLGNIDFTFSGTATTN